MNAPRRFRLRAWCAAGAALVALVRCPAAPSAPELELKAAFIFHFTQFVDWPPRSYGAPTAPFVIGVFGEEPIEDALTAMVQNEKMAGHPVEIRRLRRASDAAACQIVYVSSDGETLFRRARLHGVPVLTVGETESFLQSGGVIEFFTEQNHVRLRINLPAAKAASLQVSAKLLRVAQIFPP